MKHRPRFIFIRLSADFRHIIDDDRSVALHFGEDESGTPRWAIKLINKGHETFVGLSDEALDAIVGMYVQLISKDAAHD